MRPHIPDNPATAPEAPTGRATADGGTGNEAAERVDVFNELRGKWRRRKFEVRKPPPRNSQFRWNHDMAVLGAALPAGVKVTLMAAARYYGDRNGRDMIFRQSKLAALRGVCAKTVQRHLAVGRAAGLVDWEHRSARDPESGQVRQLANRYRLMIPADCVGRDGKVRRPDAAPEPQPPAGWTVTNGAEQPRRVSDADPAAASRRAWSKLSAAERERQLVTARRLWAAAKPRDRNVAGMVAAGVCAEAAVIVSREHGQRRARPPRAGP